MYLANELNMLVSALSKLDPVAHSQLSWRKASAAAEYKTRTNYSPC